MSRHIFIRTARGKAAAGLCLVAALALAQVGRPGSNAKPRMQDRSEVQPTPNALKPKNRGKDACSASGCHAQSEPYREQKKKVIEEACLGIEVSIWEKEDNHSRAYAVLKGTRAKSMEKLLPYGDVSQAQACLSCHAGVTKKVKEQARKFAIPVEEGVTCVICHGAGDWVEKHLMVRLGEAEEWRRRTRQEKQAIGMNDLWDARKRAEVCAACHIGNAAEGKFVTHAMYAAGHPPLPSIEFAAFCEEMPRHWEYLREKDDAIQKTLLKDKDEKARRIMVNSERTQVAIIGGAVALRASLELIVAKAQECAAAKEPEKQVLDFALFDCAGCHHELKYPGWRQARGYEGIKPGRPTMAHWPTTLARIAYRYVRKDEKQLDDALGRLAEAFGARPFGEPAQVAKAATATARQAQDLVEALTQSTFDEETAKRLQGLLTDFTAEKLPDYDAARQRAWAFFMVSEELGWKKGPRDRNAKQLYRSRLTRWSEPLKGSILLTLPSDRNRSYDDQLAEELRAVSNYDPLQFKRAFEALARTAPK